MKRHRLPHTDLEVSALGFGAGGFGTAVKDDALDRLAADFLAAGGSLFDTAHVYAAWEPGGAGLSERELGACLRRLGCVEQTVIATKGGHPTFGEHYPRPTDFLAERVVAQDIEESLDRLGRTCIDLYFLHRDDGRTPVGEIIEMLNREIRHGRLRHIGASNWSVERIAEANRCAAEKGLQGFVASQVQWSLAEPNWRPGPEPTTRFVTPEESAWYGAHAMPILAYSATAGGYFAGRGHEAGLYANPENAARCERARTLAARLGCTPTQIALAWLMRQPPTVIPLFSTTNREHLAELLGAASLSLTPEQAGGLR